jgi:hypothetical protein
MTEEKIERLQARLAQFRSESENSRVGALGSDFGDDPPPMAEQLRYLVLENRDLKADVVRLRGELARVQESVDRGECEGTLNGRTAEEWLRLAEAERTRADAAEERVHQLRAHLGVAKAELERLRGVNAVLREKA